MCGCVRQALTPSQVIAVLEVRNLTGLPATAGAQLRRVIQAELNPLPTATVLREAALSQSRVRLDSAGCGARRLASCRREMTHLATSATPTAMQEMYGGLLCEDAMLEASTMKSGFRFLGF